MKTYQRKINKATLKWIKLFTSFHEKEGRLPTDKEMSTTPDSKDRRAAMEIVKKRFT